MIQSLVGHFDRWWVTTDDRNFNGSSKVASEATLPFESFEFRLQSKQKFEFWFFGEDLTEIVSVSEINSGDEPSSQSRTFFVWRPLAFVRRDVERGL